MQCELWYIQVYFLLHRSSEHYAIFLKPTYHLKSFLTVSCLIFIVPSSSTSAIVVVFCPNSMVLPVFIVFRAWQFCVCHVFRTCKLVSKSGELTQWGFRT